MGSKPLYTVDTALEALKKYDIQESDLLAWEKELRLDIPVDEYGRKQYSPHHVNLFKNIKKHLALGRTIEEIQEIINLPPIEASKPQPVREPVLATAGATTAAPQTGGLTAGGVGTGIATHLSESDTLAGTGAGTIATQANPATQANAKVIQKSPYASIPKRPQVRGGEGTGEGAAHVINLVNRLNREKDQLYKKLLETEKLNSHLYSANSLFHNKVREMAGQISELRKNQNENEKFKLLEEKSKLHKQLLDSERAIQARQEEVQQEKNRNEMMKHHVLEMENRIAALTTPFDASKFRGDWMETGNLVEVLYDNFGINIESERVRLFRISEIPERIYGSMTIINTSYHYETNNLWKRNESLMVSYVDEQTLEGELSAEYVLDGVPVAKAIYHVVCRRSQ
jgi:DNA-binding transcriptional MerR regulator